MNTTKLVFVASWPGEPNAGIFPGYEEITIEFKHGQPIDEDTISFWQEAIQEFYDGSTVEYLDTE